MLAGKATPPGDHEKTSKHMKTLAVLLALTSVTFAADPLQPLLGIWTGKHKETYKGTGEIHSSRLTGVRRPDGGVRLTEKTSSG